MANSHGPSPKMAPCGPKGRFGTKGGNGGYQNRSKLDAGFSKPLSKQLAGKFAATGKTPK